MTKDDQFRDQYIEQFDFPYCEEVSKYEKQAKIGQVYCAKKLERKMVKFSLFLTPGHLWRGVQSTRQEEQTQSE